MLPEMSDTVRVKRLNGRRCKAGDVGELHAIFHMDCSHATRLQGAQQFRGQIVHLTEELCIIRVMAEVIVRGRIFVMVAERDTSHIQVDAVRWPVPNFFHTVVVDGRVIVSLDFHSLTSYRSLQGLKRKATETVFFDDFLHLLAQFIVLSPLALQRQQHLRLRVHVQDVDDDRGLLQETVDAVNGLNEVVELVVDAHENGAVAMALEIAAGTGQAFLGSEDAGAALCEVHDPLLSGFQLHAAVDIDHLRHGLFERLALVLQIVPDHKMLVRRCLRNDAGYLGGANIDAVPFLLGCIRQAHGGIMAELHLAVRFKLGGPVKAVQLVVSDIHRRQ